MQHASKSMGNNKLLRENKNTIVLLSVFVIVESTDIDIWIQKELVQSLGFLRPYQFQLESISTWSPPFVGFLCVQFFRSWKLPPVQKLHFFTFLKVVENIRGATCISDANYFLSWKLPPVRSCSFKAPTKCSYGDFQGRGACRSW